MSSPLTRADVAALIARRDKAFKPIIQEVGPPPSPRSTPVNARFATLVRSITSQLLATNVAATIHLRIQILCQGSVDVDSILCAGTSRLRDVGLSQVKAQAMTELAESVQDGRVRITQHGRLSDDEVIRELTAVRGIGPWTAQMYLMTTLARRDIWPVGDFGVRNGWSIAHELDALIDQAALREAGAPFEGVRSAVAWYCWQAVRHNSPTK